MSDEKRQTRLLPFRLRRAAQAHADVYERDARELSAEDAEFSDDLELSTLLRAWDAPEPSARSRERLLAEFRTSFVRAPLWRRALSAELRVPLPVAACAALVLLASLFALYSRTPSPMQTATKSNAADVRTNAEPAVKIVELPVERERVVTRYVYVDRSDARQPAANRQTMTAQQSTSTQRSATTRPAVAQSNSTREDTVRQTAINSSTQSNEEPTSYYTRVDMADFQPADEMKIRIVKRGKTDEK